jgi:hypothetical protein
MLRPRGGWLLPRSWRCKLETKRLYEKAFGVSEERDSRSLGKPLPEVPARSHFP